MESEQKINEKPPLSGDKKALYEGCLEAQLKLMESSSAVRAYLGAKQRFTTGGSFEETDLSKAFEGHPDFELYKKLEKLGVKIRER